MKVDKLEQKQRAFFWDILLGTYSPSLPHPTLAEIQSTKLNIPEQRTIHMDIPRTRSQIIPQSSHQILEKIITKFCQSEKMSYKQGINEIFGVVAVFNDSGLSWEKVYEYGRKIILDNNFFKDQEFLSLQVSFQWINQLLKFHDYELYHSIYLINMLSPELYATPWILTLFANKMSLECTYLLWEALFASQDQLTIYFIVVAVLITYRQKLLTIDPSLLPQTLTGIFIDNIRDVKNIYKKAIDLKINTPSSACIVNRVFDLNKQLLLELQYQLDMNQNLCIQRWELQKLLQLQCSCQLKGCDQCRQTVLPQELRHFVKQNQNLEEILYYKGGQQYSYVLVNEPQNLNKKQIQIVKISDELSDLEFQLSYICILNKNLQCPNNLNQQQYSQQQQQQQQCKQQTDIISVNYDSQIIVPFKASFLNKIPVKQPQKGMPEEQFDSIHTLQQENRRLNSDPNEIVEPILMKNSSRTTSIKKDPIRRYQLKGLFQKIRINFSMFSETQKQFKFYRCVIPGHFKRLILVMNQEYISLFDDDQQLYLDLQRLQIHKPITYKQERNEQLMVLKYLYYIIFLKRISSKKQNAKIISFYFKQPTINSTQLASHQYFKQFKSFYPEINYEFIEQSKKMCKTEFKLTVEFSNQQEANNCIENGKQLYKMCQLICQ